MRRVATFCLGRGRATRSAVEHCRCTGGHQRMTHMRDDGRSSSVMSARIDELLDGMSLVEKAGQLTQYFSFGAEVAAGGPNPGQPSEVEQALARGAVGSLLFVTDPAEINRLQRLAVEGNRHGIPALFGFDVIHGLRTILPVPIAMAASWDPDTIERGQAIAAREARAVEHIIAGPKHFAGYGAAVGGRDYDEANVSDAELWNVYFPPFRAAVEAG